MSDEENDEKELDLSNVREMGGQNSDDATD